MYDFSNITSANSTLQIIQFINKDWTNGSFVLLMLFSLFVIIYLNVSFYSAPNALAVTSFVMMILTGLCWLAGLIGLYVLIIVEVILFIGIFLSILFDSGG